VNAHRHVQGYVRIHTLLCIRVCICRRVRKRGQRRRICKRMPRRPRKRLQAYTQRSQPTQTIPCVVVRLDTDPLQTPVDSISGKSEKFASAHLSPAVAGVNCDNRHHQPPQSRPCRVINERLRSLRCTVKVWVCIIHVNFNFRVLYMSVYYNRILR